MSGVLAIVAAPRADGPEGTEFLRVLVALRVCDCPVTLVEAGAGVGVLSREPDLTVEGERYLDALRGEGVEPRADADLAEALAAADAVVLLPDPSRPRVPALLEIPRGAPVTAETAAELLRAGQVAIR